MIKSLQTPLLYTTAQEVDGDLLVTDGEFPADMSGVVYVAYQIGSVNSAGLPYPKQLPDGRVNPEYGSAIMSGDGMVMKIGLEGTPTIKTRIMKTPCYYADWNTRNGTDEAHKDLHLLQFKNFGISRMSLMLGARNPLNTAVTPVRFANSNPTLVAAYDVGRPYILDPSTLELKTVLGKNDEWMLGTPDKVPWAFSLIETTAHPSFDPLTQELFTVNYSRSKQSVFLAEQTIHHLKYNREAFKDKLLDIVDEHGHQPESVEAQVRLESFFENLHQELAPPQPRRKTLSDRLKEALRTLKISLQRLIGKITGKSSDETEEKVAAVRLMRFKGTSENEKWERWALEDQNGNLLDIRDCMHQTGLTRDYIILQNSSFKFAAELLINNPFPEHPAIERFIRRALKEKMLSYTDCYIVKRSDLTPDREVVTAYKLDKPIPVETIHFSCDYDNPEGEITMYGIHNAAMCVAEWVRPYDRSALTHQEIDQDVLSLFALGTMDVSRIGKWKMAWDTAKNTFTLKKEQSIELAETGNTSPQAPSMGFNTWTVGLYTYRDIVSATTPVPKITNLWFVSGGLDSRMLTEFIDELYKDYDHRIVDYDEVVKLTRQGLPFSLNQLDTQTMQPAPNGYFQFKDGDYLRSIQFVPRTQSTPGKDPALDGYIFCTMQVSHQQPDGSVSRQGEYWIFEADNVAKGPVCKMFHPDINFCFTLHSAWMEEALPSNLIYKVDYEEDYNALIAGLPDKVLIQPFFDTYVYPYLREEKVI